MASSYTSLNFHIVFSTKEREAFLTQAHIGQLRGFCGSITKEKRGTLFSLGGHVDHVHILVGLPPTLCVADFVRVFKANSSRRLKEMPTLTGFAWQRRYWAFSVSITSVEEVKRYVDNQEAHHSRHSLEAELKAFSRVLNLDDYEFDD